jgi:hypothetical protein
MNSGIAVFCPPHETVLLKCALVGNEDLAGGTIYTGTRGDYHWLTSTQHYMGDFVRLCSDAVLGRYLAITAIDSGSPWLTKTQRLVGWQLRSGIAYSQRVSSVEELFYQRDGNDCPGYDEWYVFDTPPQHLGEVLCGNPFVEGNTPQPGRLLVMVGWADFMLHSDDPAQTINEMFWRQLDWIRPKVYVSDGRDNLTCVCRDLALFESIHAHFAAPLKP